MSILEEKNKELATLQAALLTCKTNQKSVINSKIETLKSEIELYSQENEKIEIPLETQSVDIVESVQSVESVDTIEDLENQLETLKFELVENFDIAKVISLSKIQKRLDKISKPPQSKIFKVYNEITSKFEIVSMLQQRTFDREKNLTIMGNKEIEEWLSKSKNYLCKITGKDGVEKNEKIEKLQYNADTNEYMILISDPLKMYQIRLNNFNLSMKNDIKS